MKRHVKFLETNGDNSRLYNKRLLLPLRPLGLKNVQTGKSHSKTHRPAAAIIPEDDQNIKAIYIPKTMTAAPFLPHPALTPGQRRFLHNIAEAYSKDHMRQLICQHYMNVLHRCIRTVPDEIPVKKIQKSNIPEVDYMERYQYASTNKTKENGKRTINSVTVKKTTLPKIIQQQRLSSDFSKIKSVQSSKRRATIANPGSDPWESPEMDCFLAGRMSSLSFNELEEDDEDLFFLE